ncbi:hypothetical protein [Poriferisphaera corsica]|nr:hypothetical protein [Poriferisphaera corsica]
MRVDCSESRGNGVMLYWRRVYTDWLGMVVADVLLVFKVIRGCGCG